MQQRVNSFNKTSAAKAIRKAERLLATVDPVMRRLIARHGHCPLADREFQPFHMLANSIFSQQLSTKAAATIKQRVGELVGVPFQTEMVLSVPMEKLRGAGLSQAKTRYIRELAARVSDGRLVFDAIVHKDDEGVIAALVEAPGIGRWTARNVFALRTQTAGRARRRGCRTPTRGPNTLRSRPQIEYAPATGRRSMAAVSFDCLVVSMAVAGA